MTIANFEPLSAAEQKLLATIDSGEFDRLSTRDAPTGDDPSHVVRAELVRYLVLGGQGAPRLHEKGLRLSGAWISGSLDLEGCRIPRAIGLVDCGFEGAVILRSAVIDSLFLDGCRLPGLSGDGLEARGGVYLRGAVVEGVIDLPDARIGGPLALDGVSVRNVDQVAIRASNIEVRGDFSLRGGAVEGAVNIDGAKIGGDLSAAGLRIAEASAAALVADGVNCKGDLLLKSADVAGEVSLIGARIGGDVNLDAGAFRKNGERAITLNRAHIDGALFLRERAVIDGVFSLNAAHVGTIVDEAASWPASGDLLLNRCRYDGFSGGPVDARSRLDWLSRQDAARWGEDFWPQPYEQLSAVLERMGHVEDARAVLYEKERLQRRARLARTRSPAVRAVLRLKDVLLRVTVGYGLQSYIAFLWLALFWALGAGLFAYVDAQEQLRPNVPQNLRQPEWVLCGVGAGRELTMSSLDRPRRGLAAEGQSQMACFRQQPEAASYPKFNAVAYALDTLLPGFESGQRTYWSPDTRFRLGAFAKMIEHMLMIIGSTLGLLALAGFAGIVKSR